MNIDMYLLHFCCINNEQTAIADILFTAKTMFIKILGGHSQCVFYTMHDRKNA